LQAAFASVSISVIYSYLTIESFVNYQLFQCWTNRHRDSQAATRFLDLLGDRATFEAYRKDKRVRELSERIKVLYRILGYPPVHASAPTLWMEFLELLETARHFLVHPLPDPLVVDERIGALMMENPAGLYSRVASDLLADMYRQSGARQPMWLKRNGLIQLLGIQVLTRRPVASPMREGP
jgi:hypothetical protein